MTARLVSLGVTTIAALALAGASIDATAPPTTVPPTTVPPTTVPPTTVPPTTEPAPVDRLTGVNWLEGTYPSPCDDSSIELVGGTAIANGERIVLDDARPLDPYAGLAVGFLSCQPSDGVTRAATVALVEVGSDGTILVRAEKSLAPGARVVALDLPRITIESPEGAAPAGGCCAPFVRRQLATVTAETIVVTDQGQHPAFAQTLGPGLGPVVGANAGLVQASVPAAAVCYRWPDAFYPQDPPSTPEPPTPASAELTTMRLALIHVTGRWIPPTSEMTAEMADVVRAYQESRGLDVDGVIGGQTAEAIIADLGCPDLAGSFHQIDPPTLGPRRFASVADLRAAMARYTTSGQSGNASLDALLAATRWDGTRAMFLGCNRRESPRAGLTCSWSGATPLQLIGLLDDPAAEAINSFSVLYARSAAA